MFWFILSALSILLLYSLLQGAPYVPTKRSTAERAFALLGLQKGELFVDIGCGDGVMLKHAAERGCDAVGIEINPLLWAVAAWRCRNYKNIKVVWGNMWNWHLPAGTAGVFLFGAGPFMERLSKWLTREKELTNSSFKVVSFGFLLPGHKPRAKHGALFLYIL
ncbi:MAG TPA: class I SAM-dependent methyltransferase [Candidatus Saccharimonadales bacterium]